MRAATRGRRWGRCWRGGEGWALLFAVLQRSNAEDRNAVIAVVGRPAATGCNRSTAVVGFRTTGVRHTADNRLRPMSGSCRPRGVLHRRPSWALAFNDFGRQVLWVRVAFQVGTTAPLHPRRTSVDGPATRRLSACASDTPIAARPLSAYRFHRHWRDAISSGAHS